MSLADDLLQQAAFLAKREHKRPAQASLRRAVSAAYYALFHLLTDDAAGMFLWNDLKVFARLKRAYKHQDMKVASQDFANGKFSNLLDTCSPQPDVFDKLKTVAETFVNLQQARNDADYNVAIQYTRTQVLKHVNDAEAAFEAWREVRKEGWARIYLGLLILRGKWDEEGRTLHRKPPSRPRRSLLPQPEHLVVHRRSWFLQR